jgi:hypothetical protein
MLSKKSKLENLENFTLKIAADINSITFLVFFVAQFVNLTFFGQFGSFN